MCAYIYNFGILKSMVSNAGYPIFYALKRYFGLARYIAFVMFVILIVFSLPIHNYTIRVCYLASLYFCIGSRCDVIINCLTMTVLFY